ncbi:hypothetical protein [Magnetospirillum moscoviense]|uniref:Response regulatory domain-containing protein n=1 Tax=Magnetospirillum moscoviense TaxID=1437059 RepID=A0A178MJY8_9PROT|nr:hypothetical protein [Magnetospirillum moscoviense]OAN48883.1 hypothetical protein A6A05_02545 [Magnetospirillum moscoviense]
MSQSFENVRLVLAEPNPNIRIGLRAALTAAGFRAITETASYIRVHDLLAHDSVDLLISAAELEGNDVGFLISENRNQRLGPNPFPLAITLLGNRAPARVRQVIVSGTDDQLLARIRRLYHRRKPFVVTHDYTGPDRRNQARAFGTHQAPMIEVPNPLRLRAENGIDGTRMELLIREQAALLNRIKIERHAVQINWLADHVHATIRDGISSNAVNLMPFTNKLLSVAEDLIRRMKNSPAEAHVAPVAELRELAHRLDGAPDSIPYSELERLNGLAKAIGRTLLSVVSPPAQVA